MSPVYFQGLGFGIMSLKKNSLAPLHSSKPEAGQPLNLYLVSLGRISFMRIEAMLCSFCVFPHHACDLGDVIRGCQKEQVGTIRAAVCLCDAHNIGIVSRF